MISQQSSHSLTYSQIIASKNVSSIEKAYQNNVQLSWNRCRMGIRWNR